jgi:hypothetical protein
LLTSRVAVTEAAWPKEAASAVQPTHAPRIRTLAAVVAPVHAFECSIIAAQRTPGDVGVSGAEPW